MRISHNWLKHSIDIGLKPQQLAEGLSMLGLEVERFEELGKAYDGFLVGEVLECQRHPNADRLTVCRVNTGGEVLQIVCFSVFRVNCQFCTCHYFIFNCSIILNSPNGEPFVL